MKYSQILFASVVAIFTLSLTSCTDQGGIQVVKYVNKSGVEVALVGDAYGNIPDSLVIPDGETYECNLRYPGMMEGEYNLLFPYNIGNPDTESKDILLKVYYNKDICIGYRYKDIGKNPLRLRTEAYVEEEKRSKNLITVISTYTFTPEDYQNSIDAQK